MRPSLLSEEDIQFNLNNLPLWERKDDFIFREIVASNFAAAVGIINAVAILAESADHHPDLLLYGWNKVRITLSTHHSGGLTKLDFALAQKIEDLKF